MSRIIIMTGKGGVGKSSLAAAHAVKSAREGAKTLLVSTDMAHNIADIFGLSVGGNITPLSENLYGLELDPDHIMKEEFPEMNRSIGKMFSEAGFAANKVADDMIFPGFDDLFSLLKIAKIKDQGDYERIIVDCAPTGETLSLLKLPELLAWYMEKFFPVGKTMVRILAPVSKLCYKVELPSSQAMDDFSKMHQKLMYLQEMLKNPENCSVRLVATPEKMVVEETKRNYMYMKLYGYQVDGLFINRVLPENMDNPFFDQWKLIQGKYIQELEYVFSGLPVNKIAWFPEEIRGMEAVEHMVESMNDDNLFQIRIDPNQEHYEESDGGYCLLMNIPGVNLSELHVKSCGLDLDISLHNFQRRLPLPNSLQGSEIKEISLDGDQIKISFVRDKERES